MEHFLLAHCEVRPISLGGEWWHPVTADGDAEDLGDHERGTLTVTSQSGAMFKSDEIEVEFEPLGHLPLRAGRNSARPAHGCPQADRWT